MDGALDLAVVVRRQGGGQVRRRARLQEARPDGRHDEIADVRVGLRDGVLDDLTAVPAMGQRLAFGVEGVGDVEDEDGFVSGALVGLGQAGLLAVGPEVAGGGLVHANGRSGVRAVAPNASQPDVDTAGTKIVTGRVFMARAARRSRPSE